jgi:hypothetical protein
VEGVPERPYLYFYISMGVAMFALGIMGLAFVRGGVEDIVRGNSGDLIEGRRWSRKRKGIIVGEKSRGY